MLFVFYVATSSKLKIMKHTLLFGFLFFICFGTFAQFQKGNKVLGFGLNFNTGKSEQTGGQFNSTSKNNGFSVPAELGFAGKANRLNGFYLAISNSESKWETNAPLATNRTLTNKSYGLGYFTRVYKSLGKNFFVFGDARAGYTYSEQKDVETITSTRKQNSVNVLFFPGIAYKWNNKFLLEVRTGDLINFGYTNSKTTNSSNNIKSTSGSFDFNSSLGLGFLQNFGIGARWIIGRNKS
jgi:hypothetical protein